MAKALDVFPGRNDPGFPWDEWLNGNVWELEPADLNGMSIAVFRGLARNTAKQRGKKLRSKKLDKGNLVIQAYKAE